MQEQAKQSEKEENESVYLVCGSESLSKNDYSLAAIVQAKLGMNPFSRETYVFRSSNQVKELRWEEAGFVTVTRRVSGLVWPGSKLGKAIKITERELEFLVKGAMAEEHKAKHDYSEIIMV